MINQILKKLADGLDYLASILDGRVFVGSRVTSMLRGGSSYLAAKANDATIAVGKIVTLPSKADVTAILTSVLTIVSNESSSSSWYSDDLKVKITALLAAFSNVSDALAHNEKIATFAKQQTNVIEILEKMKAHISFVKISETPWSEFKEIMPSDLTSNGALKQVWDNCCQMEITLKNGCGTFKIYNINNTFNGYKLITNLATLGSIAITVANIYLISKNPNLPSSISPSYSPAIAPTTPRISASDDQANHLNSVAASPFRLIVDTIAQSCNYEKFKSQQFFAHILDASDIELARAKHDNDKTKPEQIPSDLIATLKIFGCPDDVIERAQKLEQAYKDHQTALYDIELGAGRAAITIANTRQTDAEKQRDSALITAKQSEAQRLATQTQMDAALLTAQQTEESMRNLTIATKIKGDMDERTINDLAQQINILQQDLAKETSSKHEQIALVESLVTLIIQDFIESHNLTKTEKQTFIQKLNATIGIQISPEIKSMLHNIELKIADGTPDSLGITSAAVSPYSIFNQQNRNTLLQRSISNGPRLPPLPIQKSGVNRPVSPFDLTSEHSVSELESLTSSQGVHHRPNKEATDSVIAQDEVTGSDTSSKKKKNI